MSLRSITKDSTNESVIVRIIDSSDGTPEESVDASTSGLSLWYRREGSDKSSISPSDLLSVDASHSDGGLIHIDDGYYRIDLPDVAVSTGSSGIMIGGAVLDMIVIGSYYPLVESTVDANIVQVIGMGVDGSGTAGNPWGPA